MFIMNKAKLIESMAKTTKQSKAVCKEMLEAFLSTVEWCVKARQNSSSDRFWYFLSNEKKKPYWD